MGPANSRKLQSCKAGQFELFGAQKAQNDPLCNFRGFEASSKATLFQDFYLKASLHGSKPSRELKKATVAKRVTLDFSGPSKLKITRFAIFGYRSFDHGSCRSARKPTLGSGGLGSQEAQQKPSNIQPSERASCSQVTSYQHFSHFFPILLLYPALQMQVEMILVAI